MATAEEYDAARADSTTFLLAPGHEQGSIESVVLRSARFVVAKRQPAEEEPGLELKLAD